jgi:ribosomal protein L11 methyltransferase
MHFTYDNIFANINLNVLLNDICIYAKMLNSSGTLYLSGFYKSDIKKVEIVANKSNLSLHESKVKNEWVALKFIKMNDQ